jgi:hypothetical protein
MSLKIHPYEGVGPLKLGFTPAEMRSVMNCHFETFKKTPISEMPTDDFVGKGIHVYYKKPGVCKGIELFAPADPILHEMRLIGVPFGQVKSYFDQLDPACESDNSGIISKGTGVSLYIPDIDEGASAPIVSVYVFEKGAFG